MSEEQSSLWSVITSVIMSTHTESREWRFAARGVVCLESRLESWYQKPALDAKRKAPVADSMTSSSMKS